MVKTLLFATILLLPIIAYGGSPTANLSVQVVPAGSGSGALPGSILPPGTWANDLDEHFSGTSINTNTWNVLNNGAGCCGGISDCQISGELVVNNGLTLFPLPNLSDGTAHGCAVQTPNIYSTPGYFETRLQTDTGNNVWNGEFGIIGGMNSCGGDFAAQGGEVDLVEAFTAGTSQQASVQSGYGSCIAVNVYNHSVSADAYHVWGLDYGDNGAITYYKDGVQIAQVKPSDGVEPTGGICPSPSINPNCSGGNWLGQFILWDMSWSSATLSNPGGLKVAWVRHYHH